MSSRAATAAFGSDHFLPDILVDPREVDWSALLTRALGG